MVTKRLFEDAHFWDAMSDKLNMFKICRAPHHIPNPNPRASYSISVKTMLNPYAFNPPYIKQATCILDPETCHILSTRTVHVIGNVSLIFASVQGHELSFGCAQSMWSLRTLVFFAQLICFPDSAWQDPVPCDGSDTLLFGNRWLLQRSLSKAWSSTNIEPCWATHPLIPATCKDDMMYPLYRCAWMFHGPVPDASGIRTKDM